MHFFYVYTLHIIVMGFEYTMKGQNCGCDFECIFLELQILVLFKTAVFITRGAISCEVIRQIQNNLVCKLMSRQCHRYRCLLKVLHCQLHTCYCRLPYCHIPAVTCFSAYLFSNLIFSMHLLLATFDHLSSLQVTSVVTDSYLVIRMPSDSNSLQLKVFYCRGLGRRFARKKEGKRMVE